MKNRVFALLGVLLLAAGAASIAGAQTTYPANPQQPQVQPPRPQPQVQPVRPQPVRPQPVRPLPGRPQPGRWFLLGQANVDAVVDHDTISVGQAAGVYRFLQMRVQHAPIRFDHVIVRYGNGQTERLDVIKVIHPGGVTRAIPLSGGGRIVQSVELWYGKATPSRQRPQVSLFGMP